MVGSCGGAFSYWHQLQCRFLRLDLGDRAALCDALGQISPRVDLVMHFAAVAYVGESMRDPLQYYKNVTVNTVNLLDCMAANGIHQYVRRVRQPREAACHGADTAPSHQPVRPVQAHGGRGRLAL
ncbi:hypothetical protein Vretimale_19135 [Volvox reticuliferus]|uniref:NAD(P)-binding domain-containing protein n=1 Tax=Volvox reticuliferus TaxID=1737510 RepID=A0A8J4GYD6_9CHLO|nr:hypothetical protein Vretimale_19135 [Volvox reticuliferus]